MKKFAIRICSLMLLLLIFTPVVNALSFTESFTKQWEQQNLNIIKYNSIIAESDGYVAAGQAADQSAAIVKYGFDGQILWTITEGTPSENHFYNSVIATSDGGYVAVGYSYSANGPWLTNSGAADAIIVKYNAAREVEWAKNFGSVTNDFFASVAETSTGYVAVGMTNGDPLIVEYTLNGVEDYSTSLDGEGSFSVFNSVIISSDKQSVIIVGELRGKAIIIEYELNTNNDVLVTEDTTSGTSAFNSIVIDNDSYVVVGEKNNDAIISKYDLNGNVIWSSVENNAIYNSIIIVAGGFAVVGTTNQLGLVSYYGSDSTFKWHETFDGGDHQIYSLAKIDDTLVFVGTSQFYSNNHYIASYSGYFVPAINPAPEPSPSEMNSDNPNTGSFVSYGIIGFSALIATLGYLQVSKKQRLHKI